MPLILSMVKERGWDRNNVKHRADDPILVTVFSDEATGRTIFKYGAKLEDLRFWIEYFAELGRIENEKAKNHEVCKNPKVEKTSCND